MAAGARTGLGNILIAVLFLMAMFCSPLVAAIPTYATAPALVLVGVLMSGAVARIRWDDFSEAFPAFLTLVATPLTFSIATGLSLGLLSFTLVKLGTPERNLARDGYYARTRDDELKCPDLELLCLQSIEDVTDRVNAAVKPDMPPGLQTLILRAMEKAPRRRYQTVAELRRDLKTVRMELPHE